MVAELVSDRLQLERTWHLPGAEHRFSTTGRVRRRAADFLRSRHGEYSLGGRGARDREDAAGKAGRARLGAVCGGAFRRGELFRAWLVSSAAASRRDARAGPELRLHPAQHSANSIRRRALHQYRKDGYAQRWKRPRSFRSMPCPSADKPDLAHLARSVYRDRKFTGAGCLARSSAKLPRHRIAIFCSARRIRTSQHVYNCAYLFGPGWDTYQYYRKTHLVMLGRVHPVRRHVSHGCTTGSASGWT